MTPQTSTSPPANAPAPPSVTSGPPRGDPLRLWVRIAVGVVVAALVVLPLLRGSIPSPNYVLQLLMSVFLWIAMASSWNILGGYAGYVSLGHNVFFAVGGYLAGTLLVYHGWPIWLTAPLAGVAAVVVGLVVGAITLRAHGPAFIISTIALLLMTRLVADNWDLIGASNGLSLPLPGTDTRVPLYYGAFATAVGAVALSAWIRSSRFGLGLRAIAQDEVKAEVAGIDTRRYKILAFALSTAFIAVAGAIWGYSLSYLRPTAFLTIGVAADMVLMSVIGGKGTVGGPVVGAILLVGFNEYAVTRFGSSELNLVVTGALMLLVLLFFPEGIVGTLQQRLADRRARNRPVVDDAAGATR